MIRIKRYVQPGPVAIQVVLSTTYESLSDKSRIKAQEKGTLECKPIDSSYSQAKNELRVNRTSTVSLSYECDAFVTRAMMVPYLPPMSR